VFSRIALAATTGSATRATAAIFLQLEAEALDTAGMAETRPEEVTQDEVMFYDTDVGGVVHNLAYLRMIERCRTHLAAQLGFNLRAMAETQTYPVVVRTEIDYRKPGHLGDVLETRGWLDECRGVRFWCAFEMRRPEDGTLLITCRQQLALVQMPEGKLVRLPEGFRKWRGGERG
jgi:YbgC/YbaW family acyl-CoA thioester hydrolase